MPKSLPQILLLATFAAIVWVAWPSDEADPAPAQPTGDSALTGPSSGLAETDSAVIPSGSDGGGSRGSEREEVQSGHLIRIRDASGAPAAGVELRYAGQSEGLDARMFQFLSESSDEVVWQAVAWQALITDRAGEARIPTSGPFVAAVVEAGRAGHVVVGWDAEQGQPADHGAADVVLQLRAIPMVELRPLDADGTTLETGFRLVGYARSQRPASSDQPPGPWRQLRRSVGQLADGRHFLRLKPIAKDAEALELEGQGLRFRVRLSLGRLAAEKEFDATVAGPIELQLPASGEVLLTLEGYPDMVRPYLVHHEGALLSVDLMTPAKREGEAFLIEQVPIGHDYLVQVMTEPDPDDPRGTRRGLGFGELPSIRGPERAGERVEHVVTRILPPGYSGRLVLPEESEWAFYQMVAGGGGRRLQARVVLGGGIQYVDVLDLSLAPGGEFVAGIPSRLQELGDPRFFGDLIFEFEAAQPLWAVVPASLPSLDASVDVGEVRLTTDNPLLRIRVVDAAGQPIAGATLTREYWVEDESDRIRGEPWRGGWGSPQAVTNEHGELWLADRDWNTEFERFPAGMPARNSGAIERVRVTARCDGYVAQTVEFDVGIREVHLTMPTATTVRGSVGPIEAVMPVRMGFRAQGRSLQDESPHALPQIQILEPASKQRVEFELPSVPTGRWDFVVEVNGLGVREAVRLPGIVIGADGFQEPEALQNFDLSEWVGVARLSLVDTSGRPLESMGLLRGNILLDSPERGAQSMRASWAGAEWSTYVPLEGVGPVRVLIDGYQTVVIDRLRPGSQDLVLTPAERVSLTLEGASDPNGDGIVLVAVQPMSALDERIDKRWAGEPLEFGLARPGPFRVSMQWLMNGRIQVVTLQPEDLEGAQRSDGSLVIPWPFE